MIKKSIFIIFVLIYILAPVNCYAYSDEEPNQKIEEYRQEIDRSLDRAYDDETRKILDNYDISAENPSAASALKISDILHNIWQSFIEALTAPLSILGKVIAVCVFTAMIKSVSFENSLSDLYDTAGVLINVIILSGLISDTLESVEGSLSNISFFMVSYIPIFSGVLASNANISSAAGYASVMFVLCEIITFIASNLLLPLSGMVFALSIVTSVNGNVDLNGIISSVKSAVKWILTALMTIFTAVISIKGITGAAADSVATRTIRFAASSFIPIVGGSVSEAYSTIYGSLGMIRSAVGFIGIAAVAVIALKPIITICALKLIISLSAIVNDLFGQKRSSALLNGLGGVLSISLGIVTVMSMIFVISTGIVMMTSMNAV